MSTTFNDVLLCSAEFLAGNKSNKPPAMSSSGIMTLPLEEFLQKCVRASSS